MAKKPRKFKNDFGCPDETKGCNFILKSKKAGLPQCKGCGRVDATGANTKTGGKSKGKTSQKKEGDRKAPTPKITKGWRPAQVHNRALAREGYFADSDAVVGMTDD